MIRIGYNIGERFCYIEGGEEAKRAGKGMWTLGDKYVNPREQITIRFPIGYTK